MTPPAAPVLLILGAGPDQTLAPLLRQFAAGHSLFLLDADPPPWARPHLAGQAAVDLGNHPATALIALDIAARRPVAGALTYLGQHAGLALHLNRLLLTLAQPRPPAALPPAGRPRPALEPATRPRLGDVRRHMRTPAGTAPAHNGTDPAAPGWPLPRGTACVR